MRKKKSALTVGAFFLMTIMFTSVSQKTLADDQADATSSANKPKAINAYNLGVQKFNARDYKGACAAFSEATANDPEMADAFYNRAVAKDLLGDNEGAMLDANEAVRLKPDMLDALEVRARAKEKSGDLSGAFDDLNQVLEKDGNRADTLNNRALIRYKMGEKEGALADLEAAIKLKPGRQDFKQNRDTVAKGLTITSTKQEPAPSSKSTAATRPTARKSPVRKH